MKEIAFKIVSRLAEKGITTRIVYSQSSNSIYLYPNKLPNIRISDHAIQERGKMFVYNIIKNGHTNILLDGKKPIYYYSDKDVDVFLRNIETLKEKRTKN